MTSTPRPLAIVTGASSGIGYELARLCAERGYDLVIAADQAKIRQRRKISVRSVPPSTRSRPTSPRLEGVDQLYAAIKGRPVDALLANAGHGLGHGFLDQDFTAVRARDRHQHHRHACTSSKRSAATCAPRAPAAS